MNYKYFFPNWLKKILVLKLLVNLMMCHGEQLVTNIEIYVLESVGYMAINMFKLKIRNLSLLLRLHYKTQLKFGVFY
jgi:hypothetical protein